MQVCDTEDVKIRNGVVNKDHVHMHIEYPPSLSLSNLLKRLKGQSSRLLQREYIELHKRYWGKHLWAIGYGAWSTGNITDKVIEEYLKHHKTSANDKDHFELE
jgi:putative transposase